MQRQSVFFIGRLCLKILKPCHVEEFAFVQQPANLAAFELVSVRLGSRQFDGACRSVDGTAHIVAVGKRRLVALDSAEEHSIDSRTHCADGQAVLDGDDSTVAVAYEAAEGAVAGRCVVVDHFAIEEAVGDVNDGC